MRILELTAAQNRQPLVRAAGLNSRGQRQAGLRDLAAEQFVRGSGGMALKPLRGVKGEGELAILRLLAPREHPAELLALAARVPIAETVPSESEVSAWAESLAEKVSDID